jgi:hypothetical protein
MAKPEAEGALKEIGFYHAKNLDAIAQKDFLVSRKAVAGVNDVIETKLKPRYGQNFIYNTSPEAECYKLALNNYEEFQRCLKEFRESR